MDEITDMRICRVDDTDRWGVRYQFKSGRIHICGAGSLANAIAAVSRLRRPPTLRVIQGGLDTRPTSTAVGYLKDKLSLVVK
jgi:uncharacterized protein with ACT and thioredoxin-like domain